MTQADVFWVSFPGGAGRAQAGHRPAVILQNDVTSKQIPTVLAVPLTTQQDAFRFPGTPLIDPDRANGLRQRSIAPVFQITAIDGRFLEGRLGAVLDNILSALLSSLEEITTN